MHIKELARYFLPVFALLPFLILSSFYYFTLSTSFDFIDENFNILAGYFMNQGYKLFSDIFFNHHPFMAELSYALQAILKPENLYKQIVYHRLFMIAYAFGCSIVFALRFRWKGVLFVLIYEFIKYFAFGFTFQPESLLVYPTVYLFVLVWELYNGKQIYKWEYAITTIFTWIIVMMREVYVPLGFLLFGFIMWKLPSRKKALVHVFALLFLIVASLLRYDLQEFYHQIVTLNSQTVVSSDIAMYGGPLGSLFRIAAYPLYILIAQHYNHYHLIQITLSLAFFIGTFFYWKQNQKKTFLPLGITFVILAAAAIRPHPAGEALYGSYRMVIWMGIFIMSAIYLLGYAPVKYRVSMGVLLCFIALLPASYIWKGFPNRTDQYFISYNQFNQPGEAIKALSSPGDTLFVDGYGAIVYIISGLKPANPYIFNFPVQQDIEPYASIRKEVFTKKPPDFYFILCGANEGIEKHPAQISTQYTTFRIGGKGTCTYIRTDKIKALTPDQIERLNVLGYTL